MLPNEFKARLIMIDLNQSTLAEKLDVSNRTINRWLNETTIPTMAIYALKGLEHEYSQLNKE
jgi:DNA-binding XRE family transcriptional regulator